MAQKLKKTIDPQKLLLPGIKPRTFWSTGRRFNHSTILFPKWRRCIFWIRSPNQRTKISQLKIQQETLYLFRKLLFYFWYKIMIFLHITSLSIYKLYIYNFIKAQIKNSFQWLYALRGCGIIVLRAWRHKNLLWVGQ